MDSENVNTNTGKSKISKELPALFPAKEKIAKWEDTGPHDRYDDVYKLTRLDKISKVNQLGNKFIFQCENKIALSLHFYSDEIVRIRYANKGEFEQDFSYAIDPNFKDLHPSVTLEELPDFFRLITKKIHVKISRDNGLLSISDIQGNILSEDAGGWEEKATIMSGVTSVKLEKQAPKGEIFYGLGDKAGDLNLRGNKFENWCTDAFAYGAQSDPLYRSIPFYYGLRDGKAYGIFFDNSHRTWFDFDETKKEKMTMWAEGGEMNYYFIVGPELLSVASRYAQLTGKSELLPMWGLGFHQCRWSYYPESRVRELAADFRKHRIPCDALYLDIDYMDKYRCFTVNKKYFPDLGKMCRDLKKDGFHTIVMIDPGIKVDEEYKVYKEGAERGYFCMRKDGKMMRGPVWPSECAFPDFTQPAVRDWWGDLYKELYNEQAVSGFWNDMNEPAVFKVNSKTFPEDVRHDYEGQGADHAKAHNIYGLNMARATKEGLQKLQPEKRPVLVTRATYSGGQRHSALWTGDNIASWEHLAIANRQCQRLSISGFSFVGTDIGGFVDQPSGELLVRWLQLGIFHPFYRIHSIGNKEDGAAEVEEDRIKELEKMDRMDQEPWSFGDRNTDLAREAIELRYKLQPYLYSSFYEHSQTGVPVLRQLAFHDQHDPKTLLREDEFFYGDHMMVVTIHAPGQLKKSIYLPNGNWVDYWTNESYAGLKEIEFDISLHHLPIFIKAGSFIPHYPVRQHTAEVVDEYELHFYYGKGNFVQSLFEDDGEGYGYKNGNYQLRKLNTSSSENEIIITQEIDGHWENPYAQTTIVLEAVPFSIEKIEVDGNTIDFETTEHLGNKRYTFQVANKFGKIVVV